MKIRFSGRSVSALFLCAAALTAQDVAPEKIVSSDQVPAPVQVTNEEMLLPAAPAAPAYTPLDLTHKFLYSFNEMAGPTQWIGFTINAAMDQVQKSPAAWGSGSDSFGVRVASHFGRSFLRENIAFGVRALDHEDPRYFRIGSGKALNRAKYALFQTLMARRDSGGWMPAYSRFVADYATPFLAQTWRPEAFTIARGFRGGSVAIGMGFGSNLWTEFWPDMRKRVKIRKRSGDAAIASAAVLPAAAPVP